MKTILKNNIFTFILIVLVVLFLKLPVTFAQTKNNRISVPSEGILPLGSLVAENPALFDVTSGFVNAIVDTSSAGLVKVAPGELLPISIKLANFGGGKRVDVLLQYSIFSSAEEKIYESNETVAVETTASFVKTIQIPFGTVSGIYTATTSIIYQGQVVPATSQFPFTVERKILGIFQSDFFLYGFISIVVGVLLVLFGHALIKHRKTKRFIPFEYPDISHDQRIFYEILSDTIMEMRERVGDKALLIAANINGLKIDKETGRILDLTEHPSKIIATLVSEYEKLLGKKVSFSFRSENPVRSPRPLSPERSDGGRGGRSLNQ